VRRTRRRRMRRRKRRRANSTLMFDLSDCFNL
jgi:hypothetical protein